MTTSPQKSTKQGSDPKTHSPRIHARLKLIQTQISYTTDSWNEYHKISQVALSGILDESLTIHVVTSPRKKRATAWWCLWRFVLNCLGPSELLGVPLIKPGNKWWIAAPWFQKSHSSFLALFPSVSDAHIACFLQYLTVGHLLMLHFTTPTCWCYHVTKSYLPQMLRKSPPPNKVAWAP